MQVEYTKIEYTQIPDMIGINHKMIQLKPGDEGDCTIATYNGEIADGLKMEIEISKTDDNEFYVYARVKSDESKIIYDEYIGGEDLLDALSDICSDVEDYLKEYKPADKRTDAEKIKRMKELWDEIGEFLKKDYKI